MRPALWAGVVMLAFPATAAANAIILRPGDSGYARAQSAQEVAPFAALVAFITAGMWLTHSRGRGRIAAWVVFGALVYYFVVFDAGFYTAVRFASPTDPEPPPSLRLGPGELTDNEERFGIALGFIALAVGGIWFARRSVAKSQSQSPPLSRS